MAIIRGGTIVKGRGLWPLLSSTRGDNGDNNDGGDDKLTVMMLLALVAQNK